MNTNETNESAYYSDEDCIYISNAELTRLKQTFPEVPNKVMAFFDLLILADEDYSFSIPTLALAKRWQWNRSKVRRFLEKLEKEGYITKTDKGYRIEACCRYVERLD